MELMEIIWNYMELNGIIWKNIELYGKGLRQSLKLCCLESWAAADGQPSGARKGGKRLRQQRGMCSRQTGLDSQLCHFHAMNLQVPIFNGVTDHSCRCSLTMYV